MNVSSLVIKLFMFVNSYLLHCIDGRRRENTQISVASLKSRDQDIEILKHLAIYSCI